MNLALNFGGRSAFLCGMCRSPIARTSILAVLLKRQADAVRCDATSRGAGRARPRVNQVKTTVPVLCRRAPQLEITDNAAVWVLCDLKRGARRAFGRARTDTHTTRSSLDRKLRAPLRTAHAHSAELPAAELICTAVATNAAHMRYGARSRLRDAGGPQSSLPHRLAPLQP